MPDTQNRFKRLRVSFSLSYASNVTAATVVLQVWNADSGPDGNIFAGSAVTLPELFKRLGFDVTEYVNTTTEFE